MVLSVAEGLGRVKAELGEVLPDELIESCFLDAGHTWRRRRLDPVTTTKLFIQQVASGNIACDAVTHWSDQPITDSAYCQARRRLPQEGFAYLLERTTARAQARAPKRECWLGHRLMLVDGTGVSMPDVASLQETFGQPGGQKPGCGFPVAKVLAMFDASTGMIEEGLVLPLRTHDAAHADSLHSSLRPGDVLVGDRAFCSYAHVALLRQEKLEGVFRMHQRLAGAFKAGRGSLKTMRVLSTKDQFVRWKRPLQRPDWMDADEFQKLPKTQQVRVVTVRVTMPGRRVHEILLITTLLDAKRYPADEIANVYLARWRVETDIGHLKTTMKMDVLRCKSVEGVQRELLVYFLVYNLVRLVMLQAAALRNVPFEWISFVDALRWLIHPDSKKPLERLTLRKPRPGRVQPRVRKRRPKEFPLMKLPRRILIENLMMPTIKG